MYCLGISHDLWISSAALTEDGAVIGAICEERLNRIKRCKRFPIKAVDACLEMAGIEVGELDLIVSGWNPVHHLESLHPRFSETARWRAEYLYAVPNYILQRASPFPTGEVEERFSGFRASIVHMDHQVAHAANAYYLSPFEEAAFFTADGRGERHTSMWGVATPDSIEPMGGTLYPHSMGLFYGMITQFLGFRPDSDEWKVMALGSYAPRGGRYDRLLRDMVELGSEADFRLDLSMCGFSEPDVYGGKFWTPDFERAVALEPREPGGEITDDHRALASAMQRVFEEVLTSCLRSVHEVTRQEVVVLGGGCMMNSVFNGKVTRLTPFTRAFVSSCPDDSGVSVGAALWVYHVHGKGRMRPMHHHNYWGPGFDGEIQDTLEKFKIPYRRSEDAPREAARLIAEGRLVGWFQGRMEFGQRALGNRSILADPRRLETKDLVNLAVKYRESFRPFAPAILAERTMDWFETDSGDVPFMERVYMFRDEMKDKVPAVVHVDGSGRLQTVRREDNARFYMLIEAFEAATGVPIVLNTSFNLNGEPIVCSPTDAIRTFYSCGLDCLFLGDFLGEKGGIEPDLLAASELEASGAAGRTG